MVKHMEFLHLEPSLEYSSQPGEAHITKYRYLTVNFELVIELDGVNWGYSLEVFGVFKHIGDTSFASAYSAKRSATRRIERLYRFTSLIDSAVFED